MTAALPLQPELGPLSRQAALTLYAAQAADRDWALAQLPQEDRSALQKMLDELALLGFPRDPSLVRQALGARPAARAGQAATRDPDLFRKISDAAVAHLVNGEPPALAACVLALLPRVRAAAVMEYLLPVQRRAVGEVLGTRATMPARLQAAMLIELQARVAGLPPEPSPWLRLRSRWDGLWHRRGKRV